MTWIDELWMNEPGVPAIGKDSGLTMQEKKALLAYAQGGDNAEAAEAAKVPLKIFKTGVQAKLRAKLHADDVRRLVKRGYETGALVLEHPGELPSAVVLPEDLYTILLDVVNGYNNRQIGARMDESEPWVRSRILKLGTGFAVTYGIGGRTQLASRAFEFGIIPGATVVKPPKKS